MKSPELSPSAANRWRRVRDIDIYERLTEAGDVEVGRVIATPPTKRPFALAFTYGPGGERTTVHIGFYMSEADARAAVEDYVARATVESHGL